MPQGTGPGADEGGDLEIRSKFVQSHLRLTTSKTNGLNPYILRARGLVAKAEGLLQSNGHAGIAGHYGLYRRARASRA